MHVRSLAFSPICMFSHHLPTSWLAKLASQLVILLIFHTELFLPHPGLSHVPPLNKLNITFLPRAKPFLAGPMSLPCQLT